jgi:hypothetical protein
VASALQPSRTELNELIRERGGLEACQGQFFDQIVNFTGICENLRSWAGIARKKSLQMQNIP